MTTQTVSSFPIKRVRLLEDRAFVTRVFEGRLEKGQQKLLIDSFTPVAVDKSLTVRPESTSLDIHDCRVVRRPVTESKRSSAQAQDLQERIENLNREIELLGERASACQRTTESMQQLFRNWLHQAAEDVVWGNADPKNWPAEREKLSENLLKSTRRHTELRQRVQELSEERHDLVNQLAALAQPTDDQRATVEIDLESAESGDFKIELEYCVPSACWRPHHRAEWRNEKLNFVAQACVWQNTGEDWTDVKLSFSTQRAALGTEPPRLSRDVVRLKKKQKTVVVETREESVQILEKKVDQVPGIDDGGEVLNLEAPHRATILSNGRPNRVELFDFQADAKAERKVVAELAPCLFLNSRQCNEAARPLLAGPVDLVKESGLVGKSSVDFVSPGQDFVLSWGPDPSVRVHRDHRKEKEDGSFASSWKTTPNKIEVHLSNLGKEEKTFKVTERIPVSELKDVKIEQDMKKTTGSVEADANGFVSWTVTLPARGRKALELHYSVSKKKKVEGDV